MTRSSERERKNDLIRTLPRVKAGPNAVSGVP